MKRCNLTAVNYFERGSHAKDSLAITALGQCYFFGAGVDVNPEIGSAYVKIGAEYEEPVVMSIRGWQKLYGCCTDQNLSLGFQLTRKSVDKGNKHAKMNLAKCYMHGVRCWS